MKKIFLSDLSSLGCMCQAYMNNKYTYVPMILLWTEEQAIKWWPGRAMVSYGRQTIPTITFLLQVGKLLLYKKVKFFLPRFIRFTTTYAE